MKCKDCESVFNEPFIRLTICRPKADILNTAWGATMLTGEVAQQSHLANLISLKHKDFFDSQEVCPNCHSPNIEEAIAGQ